MIDLFLTAPALWAFLILLIAGYAFGRLGERRHYRRLIAQEAELTDLPAVASRYPPEREHHHQQLVAGNVVIASDYFRNFVAGLVNIFGGRVTPFESLLDRARREAMVRMKRQARERGAHYVFNVKYETARITAGRGAALEVLAYGTALTPVAHDAPPSP